MHTNNKKILLDLRKIIDSIVSKYDKIWIQRNRKIDSKFLISFIFKLVSDNKKGYGILLSELWEDFLSKKISPPQKNTFAISSICEARQKFPEEVFKEINDQALYIFNCLQYKKTLAGHNLFAIDGSKLRLQKKLFEEGYKKFNSKAYYPSGLLSCLYNVDTHFVHDFILSKNFSERDSALQHINTLGNNDVVMFDRGYFSFLLLRKITDKNAHAIFRIKEKLRNEALVKFMSGNKNDGVISFKPSSMVQYDLKKIGHNIDFSPIKLRIIKQKIKGKLYVFATTLIGKQYKKSIFADLYHKRWDIEELYKISKKQFSIEDIHAKTDRGVKQELYAQFVLINIARFFEIQASNNNNSSSDRINFKGCLSALSKKINTFLFKGLQKIIFVIDQVFQFISKLKYKNRPNRTFPRVSYKPAKIWRTGREVIVNAHSSS